MIFYVLTSAGLRGRCWKPEPERWGFQHLPRGPAEVNASGNHVWSGLLNKNIQLCRNIKKRWRKWFEKFHLPLVIYIGPWIFTCIFWKRYFQGNNSVTILHFLSCMLLMLMSEFVTVLKWEYVKLQDRFITALELPSNSWILASQYMAVNSMWHRFLYNNWTCTHSFSSIMILRFWTDMSGQTVSVKHIRRVFVDNLGIIFIISP